MSESGQNLENTHPPSSYPCDSSHSVTAAPVGRCMNKCRGEIPIVEKAICPFNETHQSFAEEVDHKESLYACESESCKIQQGKSDTDGKTQKNRVFESFSSATSLKCKSCEKTETGCESGLEVVGGIRNYNSFASEADESGKISHNDPEIESNGNNQQPRKTLNEDCLSVSEQTVVSSEERLKSTGDMKSIEQRSPQSENATLGSLGNGESIPKEERFDYTKYIPSEDLKEDFLKSIGKPSNGQVYDTKCQFASYPFAFQQWPLEYHFPPQFQNPNGYQSTGVPQTFLSFSNMYNMIPAVSTGQASYTCSYGFHDQTGGPGSLQSPGQGYDYCVYPAARPSYYRSFYRRRNLNNSFRHSNHKNNDSNNYEIHTETFLNNFNQPQISMEEGHHLRKVCKNDVHFEESSIEDGDIQEHFVDIGEVPAKQESEVSGGSGSVNLQSSQDELKKSEIEKQIRKIKKKLAEISGLEEKYHKGANLDCDQLKKLSRKSEFEDQLQSLNLS